MRFTVMRIHNLTLLLLCLGLCSRRCLSEPIKLQALADWTLDDAGNPTRSDIFCSGDLQDLPVPSTATAAAALQSLCLNRTHFYKEGTLQPHIFMKRHRLPYFSNSSLDAFLAGRFAGQMSYGTGLWERSESDKPWSSEPNTPWMLADYSLSMNKNQSQGSAWKAIRGTAQLDVLLCSDPDCTVVADFQNVTNGEAPASLTLAFSGSNRLWNSAWGTVRDAGASSSLHNQQDWLSNVYKASKEPPQLQAVTWLVPNTTVTQPSKNSALKAIGYVLPLRTLVRLNATHQQRVRVGFYKATILLPSRYNESVSRETCVTILWPDTAWMRARGFGLSLDSASCRCGPDAWGCRVYLFDTFLPTNLSFKEGDKIAATSFTLQLTDPETLTFSGVDDCFTGDHRCSVLLVGSATIAAMPLPFDGRMVAANFAAEFVGTLHKMHAIAATFDETVMPWCGTQGAPNCSDPVWGRAHLPGSQYVPARLSEDEMLHVPADMCIVGYGCPDRDAMTAGIQSILSDVVRVLDQAVTSELATTDTTKTVAGALLELSLTLVGLVAMASGFRDLIEWCVGVLSRVTSTCCPRWTRLLAKGFACGVVLLALVMPPIFSLVAERQARRNNASGTSSKVGLLAADAASYVVVGVVSVQLQAEYSWYAWALVIVNLALSGVGALLVCLKVCRTAPRAARTAGDATDVVATAAGGAAPASATGKAAGISQASRFEANRPPPLDKHSVELCSSHGPGALTPATPDGQPA